MPQEPRLIAGTEEKILSRLYQERFQPHLLERRREIWRRLYHGWFSQFVEERDAVLEIAPGYCEFINTVGEEHERVGVDLNPDTTRHAAAGVSIFAISAERMEEVLPRDHFGVAFASNFFEHCHSRDQVLQILHAARSVLKPGGRLLILGPNFKYCTRSYFDFFDHHLPLTDRSMVEALVASGFAVERAWPRTLPFTMQGSLPTLPWLVSLYLKLPVVWPLFGAQFFIVARRPASAP
jgi:SAM-dependent methyltransferase